MGAPVVDHRALTVTDLDVSEPSYAAVLDLVRLADSGHARVLAHRPTGSTPSLVRHGTSAGARFDETRPRLDHVGFPAASRDALEALQARLAALDATHTPIRDLPLGSHLDSRDPDGTAQEFFVPGPALVEAMAELRVTDVSPEGLEARARELMADAGVSS